MALNNNLLTELHRWAHGQDENFTTEAFAHLLKRLIKDAPNAIDSLMRKLTGLKVDKGVWSEAVIDTQVHTAYGTPDLSIVTPTMTIYIEVKVEADLAEGQAEGYLCALEDLGDSDETTQLALLTKYQSPASISSDVHRVRWYEIIDELEKLENANLSEVTKYLVDQFVVFLTGRGMAMPKVRSEISAGIRQYLSRVGDESVFSSRLRSPKYLLDEKELQPLHDLLSAMSIAIEHAGCSSENVRFDSGQHEGGWLGWNIDGMKFFFYIRLSSPDTIVFETDESHDIFNSTEVASKDDGVTGRLHEQYGGWKFACKFDLVANDSKFFRQGKKEQMEVLIDFVKSSQKHAQSLV